VPFASEGLEPGIGLALSGGGFRATLFHCGALWRLNECRYLSKLARISSVSGGSITAGMLALKWKTLTFANGQATNLGQELIDPLRAFCGQAIDVPSIIEGALLPWKTIGKAVQAHYDKALFKGRTLQDLPDDVTFVFNSTNLATGVDFRFSKPYAGDYRIGLIRNPTFPLALAVAASSAFPPVLSPVELDVDTQAFERTGGSDLYDLVDYRRQILLTDGGAYDNLGLETLWRRFETLLVSDAGAPFSYGPSQHHDWLHQSLRALDIATNQSRAMRKRVLIDLLERKVRKGTYWGIMTWIEKYQAPNALPVPRETTDQLAKIRTRLNPFSEAEQCSLINWGYAVSDAALRKWVDPALPAPPGWPYPAYALDRPLDKNVKIEPKTDLSDPGEAP